MKTKFENIKARTKEFFKTDKARIGGACVCALLICVGVGFGVNAIATQNAQNLPSKALNEAMSDNSKTEGENTDNKPDNATENTDEVTVNDKGEVVDSSGNVVAESVEQYNATPQAQSRPVNTATSSNTPQAQPSGITQPAHTHSWATRCIQEAWDEPIYSTREYDVCLTCGARDFDANHMEQHALRGENTQSRGQIETYISGHNYHKAVYQDYCTTCNATR